MTLQDYTTEELKNELKRRVLAERAERQKAKAKERKPSNHKAVYDYANAVVTNIRYANSFMRWEFSVVIDHADAERLNIVGTHFQTPTILLLTGAFNKQTAPKIGDRVKLRNRITKARPRWATIFHTPRIVEKLN